MDDSRPSPRVRRPVVLGVLAWLVATAVAGWLSWTAIDAAGRQVVTSVPAAVGDGTATNGPAGDGDANAGGSPSASLSSSAPGTTTPATVPSSAAAPSPGAPSSGPGSSGPGSSAPAPTAPAPRPTASSEPVPPSDTRPVGQPRTVTTRGGTTAATCRGDDVTVTYATPASGWTARVEPEGGEGARAEFRADDERVRVQFVCAGGQVQASVEDG